MWSFLDLKTVHFTQRNEVKPSNLDILLILASIDSVLQKNCCFKFIQSCCFSSSNGSFVIYILSGIKLLLCKKSRTKLTNKSIIPVSKLFRDLANSASF